MDQKDTERAHAALYGCSAAIFVALLQLIFIAVWWGSGMDLTGETLSATAMPSILGCGIGAAFCIDKLLKR